MSTLALTFLIAFGFFLAALALLGISQLLTGKSRLRAGMCGRTPEEKRDAKKGCGNKFSCGICGRDGEEEE